MRPLFRFIPLLLLCVTTVFTAQAQDKDDDIFQAPTRQKPKNYKIFSEPKGYRTFGLDLGLSYLGGDVATTIGGWGIGLTYEKNITHRDGGAFDIGWRGRGLFTNTVGIDVNSTKIIDKNGENGLFNGADYRKDSLYFANFKNNKIELAVEGVITLNGLREKTGVYATVFGGIGANWFWTKTDQLDASGNRYNYKSLGVSPSVAQLREFRDGNSETKIGDDAGIVRIMPSVGFELGYHFTPKFFVALSHRASLTQMDSLDGQIFLKSGEKSAKQDWLHYTNLQFKWILGERSDQPVPPKVLIIRPDPSPYTTNDQTDVVRARIKGVESYKNVSLRVNGREYSFNYYNNELTADVQLNEGENEIIVKATNDFGSDSKKAIYIYRPRSTQNEPKNDKGNNNLPNNGNNNLPNNGNTGGTTTTTQPAPTVRFITPSSNYSEVTTETQTIRVRVGNVASNQDLFLSVNGQTDRNFRFDGTELTKDIHLREGQNTVSVSASNRSGTANDAVTIVFRRPQTPSPTVRITSTGNPQDNGFGGCRTSIQAQIENVTSRNDVSLVVNGRTVSDFSYDTYSKILRGDISLATGSNRIEIRVRNTSGEGRDEATVSCTQQRRTTPPTVRINTPYNGQTVDNQQVGVAATVANVSDRNQIEIFADGYRINNFDFSSFNQSLNFNAPLHEGENILRVRITTPDGSAEDVVRVNYRARVVVQPPRIQIVTPQNGASVLTPSVNLEAMVENVQNKNQIQVLANGASVLFDFNPNTRQLRAIVTANDGQNRYVVRATNEGGSDEAATSITKKAEVVVKRPPTVRIVAPTNGTVVETPSVNLVATTQNISDRSQIRVLVNGQDVSFDAEKITNRVRANLTLIEGQNGIRVVVSNKDGADEATVNVTFNKVVAVKNPPVITITNPANGATASLGMTVLEATIANISSANQVKAYLNGTEIPFNFGAPNKIRTRVGGLQLGQNVLTVKATNADGVDEKSVTVAYGKGNETGGDKTGNGGTKTGNGDELAAVISNFSTSKPVVDPFDPKPPVSAMSATVVNVAGKDNIELLVDGVTQTDFTYNAETKQMRYIFNPTAGKTYVFLIKATNSLGTVSKEESVKF